MLGDRYRLERLLAKGGMGRVYVATQLPLGRQVAVKVLATTPLVDGEFRRRFLLEASVCSRITHANVVVVHDYGEHQGELYMAMELLDGEPLDKEQQRVGPMDPLRIANIGLQVSRGLRAAHREGVAHRDLKPGNVFLLAEGEDNGEDRIKVLDFGLVKVFEEGRVDVELDVTSEDIMLGSPRYMSPEQIENDPVDARSDIYSFGALLFSLACGRPPFTGRNSMEVLSAHLRDPVPNMAEVLAARPGGAPHPVSASLQVLVERCLEKKREDRFQSIDEVIAALEVARLALGHVSDSAHVSGPRRAQALAIEATTPDGLGGGQQKHGVQLALVAVMIAVLAGLALAERQGEEPAARDLPVPARLASTPTVSEAPSSEQSVTPEVEVSEVADISPDGANEGSVEHTATDLEVPAERRRRRPRVRASSSPQERPSARPAAPSPSSEARSGGVVVVDQGGPRIPIVD